MKLFINLTPHVINEVDSNTSFAPSGSTARVSSETNEVNNFNGISIVDTIFGEVEGLPAPESDVIYIVSGLVLAACSDRTDLVAPGALKRNDAGQPIGCIGFRCS